MQGVKYAVVDPTHEEIATPACHQAPKMQSPKRRSDVW